MEHTQWYIGAPNGVVLCVDALRHGELAGRFYSKYQEALFASSEQMVHEMERLFDTLRFPFPGSNERYFVEADAAPGSTQQASGNSLASPSGSPAANPYNKLFENTGDMIMNDEQLLRKHGDLGTFIVRVQHRQNSSWQGRITWMEEDKTVQFRSVWEMVKLIENAVDTVSPDEDEEVSWEG